MFKIGLITFLLCAIPHISKGEFCFEEKMENCTSLNTLLYEEVGCEPVIPEGSTVPTEYNCSSVEPSPNYCVYKGIKVDVGKSHNFNALSCNCIAPNKTNKMNVAMFKCNNLENYCSEDGNTEKLPENCHSTFTLGNYCSTGHICVTDENRDSIAKCQANGKTYLEGQYFQPHFDCKICVCKKGFNGTLSAPFCKNQDYVFLHSYWRSDYAEMMHKKCAPIFVRVSPCFVTNWLCPEDYVEIQKIASTTTNTDSNLKCTFSNKEYKIGERFHISTRRGYGECECDLPPLLTCKYFQTVVDK